MSKRRQADYLTSLLSEDAPTAPADADDAVSALVEPTPPPTRSAGGMTLLGRESALARLSSGEVKQVTQLLLDPARVRIWAGNARHQASLNEENCADLIDSIIAEGGQKVPALVRRIADDPNHEYEAIIGTRRHFAVSWLRAHNYPETMFLAQVQTLDDETAFRLADIENRARKDVSDFERARNYREALKLHYGGKQVRMAERLRLSQGWLSKLMTVANLPDWIVEAFASPSDIQLKTCYPLAQRISSIEAYGKAGGEVLKAMRTTAERTAREQADLRRAGSPPLAAPDVIKRLLQAAIPSEPAKALHACNSAHGRLALSVLSANRNGVTLRLHAGSGASDGELADMVRAALSALDEQGKGLLK